MKKFLIILAMCSSINTMYLEISSCLTNKVVQIETIVARIRYVTINANSAADASAKARKKYPKWRVVSVKRKKSSAKKVKTYRVKMEKK